MSEKIVSSYSFQWKQLFNVKKNAAFMVLRRIRACSRCSDPLCKCCFNKNITHVLRHNGLVIIKDYTCREDGYFSFSDCLTVNLDRDAQYLMSPEVWQAAEHSMNHDWILFFPQLEQQNRDERGDLQPNRNTSVGWSLVCFCEFFWR